MVSSYVKFKFFIILALHGGIPVNGYGFFLEILTSSPKKISISIPPFVYEYTSIRVGDTKLAKFQSKNKLEHIEKNVEGLLEYGGVIKISLPGNNIFPFNSLFQFVTLDRHVSFFVYNITNLV